MCSTMVFQASVIYEKLPARFSVTVALPELLNDTENITFQPTILKQTLSRDQLVERNTKTAYLPKKSAPVCNEMHFNTKE